MGTKNNTEWDLVTGKLYGELDDKHKETFDKWSREEGNRSILWNAEKIHNGLNEVKVFRFMNKNSSWLRVSRNIKRSVYRKISISVLKYAAIIVFAILIGKFTNNNWNNDIQYAKIEVLDGQMGHLFLFDGTEVWLNSGSRFKYPDRFNSKERNVYLDGEAYFKVTSNRKLPFIVHTDKMQVEVLGTSFNVSAYKNENQESVVLEEGKVQINHLTGKKILDLLPGQRAVKACANSTQFRVDEVKTSNYTTWKDGIVVFDAESIDEIAKKLERWYNVKICIDNEELRKYTINGTILRNKPIDQVMEAIGLLAPVKYEHQSNLKEKDIIHIKKR